jgi:hypothetical protein
MKKYIDTMRKLSEGVGGKFDFAVSSPDKLDMGVLKKFVNDAASSDRNAYLTPYGLDDLKKMTVFSSRKVQAGFAVKSDGDIVSAFNNSSEKGMLQELLPLALKAGGNKLDHLDGVLSGLYSRGGFGISNIDDWDDQYAPPEWEYAFIDIFDPRQSAYAEALALIPEEDYGREGNYKISAKFSKSFVPIEKIKAYKEGRPDIIYREYDR